MRSHNHWTGFLMQIGNPENYFNPTKWPASKAVFRNEGSEVSNLLANDYCFGRIQERHYYLLTHLVASSVVHYLVASSICPLTTSSLSLRFWNFGSVCHSHGLITLFKLILIGRRP
ncbi:hypothetical protein VNO77_14398 [Canavalia gladiata]|uniref:Uncharacterized protein n=1 Tax=Canavalia gladiata TaxID=3824 RepID=A0AAN9LZD2_CANGL